MKRIKFACLDQTIHFQLKEDLDHDEAVNGVVEEFESYKRQLKRSNTNYKIIEENKQPDGSIIIKVKKQYNNYNIGTYLD